MARTLMARDVVRRWVVAGVALLSAPNAGAAELEPRTIAAWDAYQEAAIERFVSRATDTGGPSAAPDAMLAARPGSEDGILSVPGGLIHHWRGAVYLRGAKLEQVLRVSCAYDAYSRIYRSVTASRLLAREGNTSRVYMRIREAEGGITAVLDVRSSVRYVRVADARVYAISNATEIREVRNVGRPDEHLLPAGQDSGYLWRAATLSYFEQRSDGVYHEMETLGLSRRFPPLLGWIIEPIARRLGRRSIERSLDEFRAAVEAGRLAPGACADLAASAS